MYHRRPSSDKHLQIISLVNVNNIECNYNEEKYNNSEIQHLCDSNFLKNVDVSETPKPYDHSKSSSPINVEKMYCKQSEENEKDCGSASIIGWSIWRAFRRKNGAVS